MASIVHNIAKVNWMKATLDMDAASNIRARLLMTTTTIDTEKTKTTIGGFTTKGESDDTSYSQQTLTSTSVVKDDTNHQAEFTSANVTFNLAGNAANDYVGHVLVDNVDGGNGDIPVCFNEFQGQPIPKEVTQLTVTVPTDGWVKIT